MLRGSRVALRPVRETDLDRLYEASLDLASRGPYYPLAVRSEAALRREFAEHGFWDTERDRGTLLIEDLEGRVCGEIDFFRPVSYWDAVELSYQLHDPAFAGRGYTTEAVQLLVDYLFAARRCERIQLAIVPQNVASRRVAEKCGFVEEGTARRAFFVGGRHHDLVLYSLVRGDTRPWHRA
jgi:[ribosomal protein S5]-alanine N-acetyltransferase